MIKNYFFIAISLLVCLFIYLFYRTEKTVVNNLAISLISLDKFQAFRKSITSILPLNERILYSLPEGLWVFCVTLTSKFFFIKIGNRQIRMLFVPLIFSIGLELCQLLHLTNGRFDFWDIGFSILFWAFACYLIRYQRPKQNIFQPFSVHSFICFFSYLIVYLAHISTR